MVMMCVINIIFMLLLINSSLSENVTTVDEKSPAFGYHLKFGVHKARVLLRLDSLKIVGGSQVNTADAVPYQAGIIVTLTTGWTSICGGSLIANTRVLTAAHCWWDGQSQGSLLTVVLGSTKIFSGGTRIATTAVTVHPLWTAGLMYDIASVKINSVSYSNNIQAIPLPNMSDVNLGYVGLAGLITGYGKITDAQSSFPTTTALHQTSVTVISNSVCQNSFTVSIHGSHVCTSGSGGKGTCDGDSGGPLTVVHNNRRTLIGVVAFGPDGNCQSGQPSVYTRVTAFLNWIEAQI